MSERFSNRMPAWLWWVVPIAVGLAVRLYVCFAAGLPTHESDTRQYLAQAQAIRQGSWASFLPNGYPLLICLIPLPVRSSGMEFVLLGVNCALSVATILIAGLITYHFCRDRRMAFVAAFLAAIWPNQINYVRFLLTETPATFFVAVSGLFFCWRMNGLAGLFLGLAVVFRTSLLPMLPAFPVLLLSRKACRAGSAFLAGSLIPLLVVGVLAWSRTGGFSLGDNTGPNLIVAHQSHSTRGVNFRNVPLVRTGEGLRIYLSGLRTNPVYWAEQRVSALWEVWGFWPSSKEGARSTAKRLLIAWRFPLLLLGLAGFWFYRKDLRAWYLLLPVPVITAVHTMFFSEPRFSCPAEPFLIVLAVLGLDHYRHAFGRFLGGGET